MIKVISKFFDTEREAKAGLKKYKNYPSAFVDKDEICYFIIIAEFNTYERAMDFYMANCRECEMYIKNNE